MHTNFPNDSFEGESEEQFEDGEDELSESEEDGQSGGEAVERSGEENDEIPKAKDDEEAKGDNPTPHALEDFARLLDHCPRLRAVSREGLTSIMPTSLNP